MLIHTQLHFVSSLVSLDIHPLSALCDDELEGLDEQLVRVILCSQTALDAPLFGLGVPSVTATDSCCDFLMGQTFPHLLIRDDNAAKFCMNAYNNHCAKGCSKRLFDLLVSAAATGRASGAVVTALAIAYAEGRMSSNLVDLIKKFQDHFELPNVIEEFRLRGCRFFWSALHSVLPKLSPPATPSSDAAQEAIDFLQEAIDTLKDVLAA